MPDRPTAVGGQPEAAPCRLSVLIPVYNERYFAEALIERALAAPLPAGVERELVVVDDCSTDGTEQVLARVAARYPDQIRLHRHQVNQGKGAAVRTALAHATGSICLIQDADLEYDLADYEILLAPLAARTQSFVLGSRHGQGGWAMRKFTDQPVQAFVLNAGHWFFTLCINGALGIWLRDPFTMYKVFRRDCLAGLKLECNRFDFDWELLIKLVRRGHRPIEIPVSYESRSFKEGKKITYLRDPLTWLWALVKYRLGPI